MHLALVFYYRKDASLQSIPLFGTLESLGRQEKAKTVAYVIPQYIKAFCLHGTCL